jgi:acetyl-CoA C-acetyltransferase
MDDVVITAALRTAVGKFNGSVAKVAAVDLGAQIIKALWRVPVSNRIKSPS